MTPVQAVHGAHCPSPLQTSQSASPPAGVGAVGAAGDGAAGAQLQVASQKGRQLLEAGAALVGGHGRHKKRAWCLMWWW